MLPAAPIRAALAGAVLLGVVVLMLVAVSGCRQSSSGARIDPLALERELERIVSLRLVTAHFYDREVEVACIGIGDEELHFKCHVDAKNPLLRTQAWDELVTCTPPTGEDVQRCVTAGGDALQ